ncbi:MULTISPECIES: type I-G CRISPR-associated RAMP protein Csb1/Cas7g [Corynebacterium]|uniref:type I-G CRISPR-associated RAMP protein Csb1/Cas7g n=1 Tax=Corynebacterium TaxID=1716 RepID=UPI0008A131F6|nr:MULTISPECIES: type I-U CRISPR-associated RAMP protein Csb1/Cas7u [Corynebacterium]OFT75261.1 type I-U CRISPR-associated protein Cas7 [Corynebacterium sp. HMSC30G07]PLA14283.1 type I-U CRISPR-associated protein Cas7 [Corynebacterium riegelii]
MQLQDLLDACTPGGASVLTSVTELSAAAGPHASVTPAKFIDGSTPCFGYEPRFIDGAPTETVIIDSIPSAANRGEQAITRAIEGGDPLLSRIPRILVHYGSESYTDIELPHRFADGHIRASSYEGEPVTKADWYRDMRNSTPRDYRAILNTAPIALLAGAWDSTRPSNQVRVRRSITGETIGILADQSRPGSEQQGARSGARVDPVGAAVHLDPSSFQQIIASQEDDLSKKRLEDINAKIKNAKKGETFSGSGVGVGALPPTLDPLGGVSCSRIIRSWVMSFTALRQLNFGDNPEQNVAARALIAALGLALIARAEQELYYRSNCDLVEVSAPVVKLDQRYGNFKELPPLSIEAADDLLKAALEHAEKLGVADWHGQVREVIGNPAIIAGAVDDAEDKE